MSKRRSISANNSAFNRHIKKAINDLDNLYEEAMSLRDDEREKKPIIEDIVYLYKKVISLIIEREDIQHLN